MCLTISLWFAVRKMLVIVNHCQYHYQKDWSLQGKWEYQFGFCEPVYMYYTASHALLFSRHLSNNLLTELPEGLFSTTTQLQNLWVYHYRMREESCVSLVNSSTCVADALYSNNGKEDYRIYSPTQSWNGYLHEKHKDFQCLLLKLNLFVSMDKPRPYVNNGTNYC